MLILCTLPIEALRRGRGLRTNTVSRVLDWNATQLWRDQDLTRIGLVNMMFSPFDVSYSDQASYLLES